MTPNTPKLCRKYLQRKEDHGVLLVMDFPPQSPDLYPIKPLWEHLKRDKRKYAVTSEDTLSYAINECWNNLKPEIIYKLIESMPKIVSAVLEAKGGCTKYCMNTKLLCSLCYLFFHIYYSFNNAAFCALLSDSSIY